MARAWLVAALALACGCAAEYVPVDEMETDDFLAGPKKRKQEFLERVQEEKQAAFSAMRVRQAKLEGCTLKGTMPCGLGRVFIFKQVRANELLFGGQSYCCPEDADVEPDLDLGTSLNQAKSKDASHMGQWCPGTPMCSSPLAPSLSSLLHSHKHSHRTCFPVLPFCPHACRVTN